nr:choice-of-anchor J domain-containing protein [uncultured Flavobacterium sp.]
MKKIILLGMFTIISAISSAQITVWEDDFNDADISDWTLLDRDEDGIKWIARQNVNLDESGSTVVDGDFSILGNYVTDLNTLETISRFVENWAITPVVNLSQHAGKKVELVLNAQTMIYDSNQNVLVYGSTSTDPDTFTLLGTVTLLRQTVDEEEFQDYTVDISQFAGEATVYIAIANEPAENSNFFGLEIDKVTITAGGTLGIGEQIVDKNASFLKQNPVTENLELQLGDQYEAGTTSVQIYNAGGTLTKQTVYNNENIAVGDLSQGLYFLVLKNGTRSQTIKFIKK